MKRKFDAIYLLFVFAILFHASVVAQQTAQGTAKEEGCSAPVYQADEVDRRVKIVAKPEAEYTEEARSCYASGTVILDVVFCRTGKTADIKVISELPHGLTEKAIEAARKIEFIPAEKGGEKVSQRQRVEYTFNPN